MKRDKLYIICGESCTGKDSVGEFFYNNYRELNNIQFTNQYVTRELRESDNTTYERLIHINPDELIYGIAHNEYVCIESYKTANEGYIAYVIKYDDILYFDENCDKKILYGVSEKVADTIMKDERVQKSIDVIKIVLIADSYTKLQRAIKRYGEYYLKQHDAKMAEICRRIYYDAINEDIYYRGTNCYLIDTNSLAIEEVGKRIFDDYISDKADAE